MNQEFFILTDAGGVLEVPSIIGREGPKTTKRFLESFTANIRNETTRAACARAVSQFLNWCERHGVSLSSEPMVVATSIEQLNKKRAPQTIRQHLADIRRLFDWMVVGQAFPFRPVSSVRVPRYSIKKGKTPELSAKDEQRLLDGIDTSHVVGLRDRAFILMVYLFARVSAVINMRLREYYQNVKRWWIRLHEKVVKFYEVPSHHKAEEHLDAYIRGAGIAKEKSKALF